MSDQKIDIDYIRASYMVPETVSSYLHEAEEIGLWQSERIIISEYLQKNDRILDVGCGTGRTTIGLYNLGYKDIQGLDLSPTMVEEARRLSKAKGLPIKFCVGDATRLEFADKTFHAAIFSFNGLMQIPGRINRIQALTEIRRVIKPGGKFIFTTHADRGGAYQEFWEQEAEKWVNGQQDPRLIEFGDILAEDPLHGPVFIHIPTPAEVRGEIEAADLRLIRESLRSSICDESDRVKETASECRFWVTECL